MSFKIPASQANSFTVYFATATAALVQKGRPYDDKRLVQDARSLALDMLKEHDELCLTTEQGWASAAADGRARECGRIVELIRKSMTDQREADRIIGIIHRTYVADSPEG